MIVISGHELGATVAVRAQPNARKSALVGEHGGALKIAVSAPPEEGRANDAIIQVLHDWLGVKRSQIELVSGQTNRNKVILIHGISPVELANRLTSKGLDAASS